jgi:phenylacetate-CoA ligase
MYKEFYDSHGFQPSQIQNYEDIEKVPIITRDIMQSYSLNKRVDARVSEKNVHKARTSGSTGQPLEIWFDKTESLIGTLKPIRYLREWGYSPFYSTIRLWGGSEPKKSIVQKFGLFKRKDIELVAQTDDAMDEILKTKCDVLFGSRSSLELFAEELDKRKAEVKPRILISVSEILMKEHRDRFREKFGCNTLNTYGSEEMGNIAWECPDQQNNLHTSMEAILINFRDVDTQSNGKIGSIITTNLENYVMPFIRYDLGDRILLPENDQCSCGRTLSLLGQVFGRNDDFITYNGRKYYWNFFYNIMMREDFLYIKRYKIVQKKDGSIEFQIQLLQDNEETRKKCVSDLNTAYSSHFSNVNVEIVNKFLLQNNRKFKVLEKEV